MWFDMRGAKAGTYLWNAFYFHKEENYGSWSLLIDMILITIILVIYMILHNIITTLAYFIYDRFRITSFTRRKCIEKFSSINIVYLKIQSNSQI